MHPSTFVRPYPAAILLSVLGAVLPSRPVQVETGPKAEQDKGWGKEITNSIGMKLVLIPKGTFTMGSPKDEVDRESLDKGSETQQKVTITKPFYMGVYEVTQGEYKKVMGKNPSWFSADGGGKSKVKGDISKFPVEQVSWEEAKAFCEKLTKKDGRGRTYRLPTDAEWEYACRGGADSSEPFNLDGKPSKSLSTTQANFDGNRPYGGAPKGDDLKCTCKVGSYKPNGFGLYDMHGNVWEWCSDSLNDDGYDPRPKVDPEGPKRGSLRVLRGGSWSDGGLYCRAAFHSRGEPGITRPQPRLPRGLCSP